MKILCLLLPLILLVMPQRASALDCTAIESAPDYYVSSTPIFLVGHSVGISLSCVPTNGGTVVYHNWSVSEPAKHFNQTLGAGPSFNFSPPYKSNWKFTAQVTEECQGALNGVCPGSNNTWSYDKSIAFSRKPSVVFTSPANDVCHSGAAFSVTAQLNTNDQAEDPPTPENHINYRWFVNGRPYIYNYLNSFIFYPGSSSVTVAVQAETEFGLRGDIISRHYDCSPADPNISVSPSEITISSPDEEFELSASSSVGPIRWLPGGPYATPNPDYPPLEGPRIKVKLRDLFVPGTTFYSDDYNFAAIADGNDMHAFIAIPVHLVLEKDSELIFRDGEPKTIGDAVIPGPNHVGLYSGSNGDKQVYESTPENPYSPYYDPSTGSYVNIEKVSGVQNFMTKPVFIHNSATTTPHSLDVDEVPIPRQLAEAMRTAILDNWMSPRYAYSDKLEAFGLGIIGSQKGTNSSHTMSCVGMIERAAEVAKPGVVLDGISFSNGEGFIPDWFEGNLSGSGILLPWSQKFAIEHRSLLFTANKWLRLQFQNNQSITPPTTRTRTVASPLYVTITDPNGKTFSNQWGSVVNEIPGASYSGIGDVEEILIPNPDDGHYQVVFNGLGNSVTVSAKSNRSKYFYSGNLQADQSLNTDIAVDSVDLPPIADAGSDTTIPLNAEHVSLDGGGSSDPEGKTLQYHWAVVGRPVGVGASVDDPTSKTPEFFFGKAGTYRISLRVSDGTSFSEPAYVTVQVVEGLPAEILSLTLDKQAYHVGEKARLSAKLLRKPANSELEYYSTATLDGAPIKIELDDNGESFFSSSPVLALAGQHQWSLQLFLQNKREASAYLKGKKKLQLDNLKIDQNLEVETDPEVRAGLFQKKAENEANIQNLDSHLRGLRTRIGEGYSITMRVDD